MNSIELSESDYAEAIDEILRKIKNEQSKHNAAWFAEKLGVEASALSRARRKVNTGKKFGGMSRSELLDAIVKVEGHNLSWRFDKNSSKIVVEPRLGKSILGEKAGRRQIYKVYYWRGEKTQVGVGVMIIAIMDDKWHQATMLIDNQYPDFKNDDPYVLVSNDVSQYKKNTYVDFIDAAATGHRQLAIFHTPSSDVKNRSMVEGVFATLTRQYNPIAGVMLMEKLTEVENNDYADAELDDAETTFEKRREFLQKIHNIPPVFYNALYRKRLDTKGNDLVSQKALSNYDAWHNLSSFAGIYEGHYIRTTKNAIQCFLLEFYENGSATLRFPRSTPGKSHEPAKGQFKWVSQPKNTLTASFDYNPDEDHWRFRFILDGEDEHGCLYGIFAGTDIKTGDPVSGRVRLKLITEAISRNDETKDILKKRNIEDYYDRLKQVGLNTDDYLDLLRQDTELAKFLNAHFKPDYTDWPHLKEPNNQSQRIEQQINVSKSAFKYAGDYELYTLYRDKEGSTQKYFILRHPVRIGKDQYVQVKTRDDGLVSGMAIHATPVLKINFSEKETAYSHMLFTVNQLAYRKIDHVYGVLTGVHVGNHRSEATIAVLVGSYSIQAEKTSGKDSRSIDFEKNEYQEYEVGTEDFFKLDSGDPAKIATFISGHSNRYISPPGEPNLEIQSRLSKYRLPYFKAACYAGLSHTKAVKDSELATTGKQVLLEQVKYEYDLFIEAMEESFHHGFCDPLPQQKNSVNDRPWPEYDIDLLIKELRPGGAMVSLIEDVLDLCDQWNRPQVREAYLRINPE
jgi:hypothetical protein